MSCQHSQYKLMICQQKKISTHFFNINLFLFLFCFYGVKQFDEIRKYGWLWCWRNSNPQTQSLPSISLYYMNDVKIEIRNKIQSRKIKQLSRDRFYIRHVISRQILHPNLPITDTCQSDDPFLCDNGTRCMMPHKLCDGKNDCMDAKDEADCCKYMP